MTNDPTIPHIVNGTFPDPDTGLLHLVPSFEFPDVKGKIRPMIGHKFTRVCCYTEIKKMNDGKTYVIHSIIH